MADKLAEVMKKLQKTKETTETPEEDAIEEVEEEEDDEEEEETEAEVPVKPVPKQSKEEKPDPEQIVAGEVNLLQNTGLFRRELMMVLHDIANSLQKLSSLVPEDK